MYMPAKCLSLTIRSKLGHSLRTLFLCWIILASPYLLAGQDCQVQWQGIAGDITQFKSVTREIITCDSIQVLRRLSAGVQQLHQKGYLLASYQQDLSRNDTLVINVYLGEQFTWAKLNTTGIPGQVLNRGGFRQKDYLHYPFNNKEIRRLFKKMVIHSENNGFPFASIYLDSVSINDKAISAKLVYHEGPKITYDSLQVEGPVKIKRSWLATYLGVTVGKPFSQRDISAIRSKINSLGFAQLAAEPKLTFQNKEATLRLELAPKRASRIDGIIGFLPNEEEEGRLLITGQFDLSLRNLFNSGKGLDIRWQSLRPRSQLLDIQYDHPRLFHSTLDFHGSFNLLREDTTFITRQAEINFSYRPSEHSLSLFSQFRSSNLLSASAFEDATELPEISDFSVDYYGIRYDYRGLNDPILPTAGASAFIDAAVGSKRIQRNADLPAELYQGLDLNSVQYTLSAGLKSYRRVNRYFILYHQLRAAKIINDRLFLNDLYRVGGLLSLRGFNENFFFASDYVLSNFEVQFHFQPGAYFFAFYDQSYLYYNVNQSQFEDYPLGIGVGLNLPVASGLVSLAYGLGRSQDQPLNLSLSKFHFGYVAKF